MSDNSDDSEDDTVEVFQLPANIRRAPSRLFAGDTLRIKKMTFDDTVLEESSRNQGGQRRNFDEISLHERRRLNQSWISVKTTMTTTGNTYFCDWCPELFGIDEDTMPETDDEENVIDELEMEELEERAQNLTESEIKMIQDDFRQSITDSEARRIWIEENTPKYGRRARVKQLLQRNSREMMECICEVDASYGRYYVPQFNGGVKEEGKEWRVPHFAVFWEEFREKEREKAGGNEWETGEEGLAKVFETQTHEEQPVEKGLFFRPVPKFVGSTKKDVKKFRKQLLGSLRPLNCREVRRCRMPIAEALYLELQEDRYFESAALFKYLMIKEHFNRATSLSGKHLLRENKVILLKIVGALKLAEKCSRRKAYDGEVTIYLKSGLYFNALSDSLWWLAEELYMKAVKVSQKNSMDGGKMEAISRYIYGTFLLDSVYRVQDAQEHLSKARDLSTGKDWTAGRILKKTQETVYKECANYLCRALIAASRDLRKGGHPEKALPLIHRSHKICQEPEISSMAIEMETYFELGMTYHAAGMVPWAKLAFRKFLEKAILENNKRSICDAFLELAICHRSEGDLDHCHTYLQKFLTTAREAADDNLQAFANRYLGEYHLNNGNSKVAVEFFLESFNSFHQQCKDSLQIPFAEWQPQHFTLPHDVELTRVLIGLAEGELLTKPLCDVMLQARDVKNQVDCLNLIKWKNSGDMSFLFDLQTGEKENLSEFSSIKLFPANIAPGPEPRQEESYGSSLDSQSDARMVRFALNENTDKPRNVR